MPANFMSTGPSKPRCSTVFRTIDLILWIFLSTCPFCQGAYPAAGVKSVPARPSLPENSSETNPRSLSATSTSGGPAQSIQPSSISRNSSPDVLPFPRYLATHQSVPSSRITAQPCVTPLESFSYAKSVRTVSLNCPMFCFTLPGFCVFGGAAFRQIEHFMPLTAARAKSLPPDNRTILSSSAFGG